MSGTADGSVDAGDSDDRIQTSQTQTQTQQQQQQLSAKRHTEWIVVKWSLAGIFIAFVAYQAVEFAPVLAKLLKNAAGFATIYGRAWLIIGIIGMIVPLLGPLLLRLFNRGVDLKTQVDTGDKIIEAMKKNGLNPKDMTEKQVKTYNERTEKLIEEGTEVTDADADAIAQDVINTPDDGAEG